MILVFAYLVNQSNVSILIPRLAFGVTCYNHNSAIKWAYDGTGTDAGSISEMIKRSLG